MGSFEMPSVPDQVKDNAREEAVAKVKRYFEEISEEGDVYGDGSEIELSDETREELLAITEDMENNDFSSAYEYLDAEVNYYEEQIQKAGASDSSKLTDELKVALARVTDLRDSLIIQE